MKTLKLFVLLALASCLLPFAALAQDAIPPTQYPQTSDGDTNLRWRMTDSLADLDFANGTGGAVRTNNLTVSQSAYTAGYVWSSGISTNFFGANGGSAKLNSVTYVKSGETNFANLELFLFSRPITAVTNNAAWGPTYADMLYCLGAISIPPTTNVWRYAGATNAVATVANVGLPVCNTYTNSNLYFVITAGIGNTLTCASNSHFIMLR